MADRPAFVPSEIVTVAPGTGPPVDDVTVPARKVLTVGGGVLPDGLVGDDPSLLQRVDPSSSGKAKARLTIERRDAFIGNLAGEGARLDGPL